MSVLVAEAPTLTPVRQDALRRLRSVAGHINGIARMIEDDAYCIDIIHQLQAVQAALNKVSLTVLDDHMHTCLTDAIRGDDAAQREQALAEIRQVFEARSKL